MVDIFDLIYFIIFETGFLDIIHIDIFLNNIAYIFVGIGVLIILRSISFLNYIVILFFGQSQITISITLHQIIYIEIPAIYFPRILTQLPFILFQSHPFRKHNVIYQIDILVLLDTNDLIIHFIFSV